MDGNPKANLNSSLFWSQAFKILLSAENIIRSAGKVFISNLIG